MSRARDHFPSVHAALVAFPGEIGRPFPWHFLQLNLPGYFLPPKITLKNLMKVVK